MENPKRLDSLQITQFYLYITVMITLLTLQKHSAFSKTLKKYQDLEYI